MTTKAPAKRPVGHPSSYKPEYCESIVRFFNLAPYITKDITVTKPDGTKIEKTVFEPIDLPLFSDWCAEIGIEPSTMNDWVKKYPDFNNAYKRAKSLQEKILVTNGNRDLYAQPFAIFTAKNILGWRDRQEIVELKFVFEFAQKVSTAIAEVLPDACPHCSKALDFKPQAAMALEELSRKLEARI